MNPFLEQNAVPIGAGTFGCAIKNNDKVTKVQIEAGLEDSYGLRRKFNQNEFNVTKLVQNLSDFNPFIIHILNVWKKEIRNYNEIEILQLREIIKQNSICNVLNSNLIKFTENWEQQQRIVNDSDNLNDAVQIIQLIKTFYPELVKRKFDAKQNIFTLKELDTIEKQIINSDRVENAKGVKSLVEQVIATIIPENKYMIDFKNKTLEIKILIWSSPSITEPELLLFQNAIILHLNSKNITNFVIEKIDYPNLPGLKGTNSKSSSSATSSNSSISKYYDLIILLDKPMAKNRDELDDFLTARKSEEPDKKALTIADSFFHVLYDSKVFTELFWSQENDDYKAGLFSKNDGESIVDDQFWVLDGKVFGFSPTSSDNELFLNFLTKAILFTNYVIEKPFLYGSNYSPFALSFRFNTRMNNDDRNFIFTLKKYFISVKKLYYAYEFVMDENFPILFVTEMEYANGGDLQQKLQNGDGFNDKQLLQLCFQMLYAFYGLHQMRDNEGNEYVHNDVKPANYLIDYSKTERRYKLDNLCYLKLNQEYIVKENCPRILLSDFGVTRKPSTAGWWVGTPGFMNPIWLFYYDAKKDDVFLERGQEEDLWSLGIVFWLMAVNGIRKGDGSNVNYSSLLSCFHTSSNSKTLPEEFGIFAEKLQDEWLDRAGVVNVSLSQLRFKISVAMIICTFMHEIDQGFLPPDSISKTSAKGINKQSESLKCGLLWNVFNDHKNEILEFVNRKNDGFFKKGNLQILSKNNTISNLIAILTKWNPNDRKISSPQGSRCDIWLESKIFAEKYFQNDVLRSDQEWKVNQPVQFPYLANLFQREQERQIEKEEIQKDDKEKQKDDEETEEYKPPEKSPLYPVLPNQNVFDQLSNNNNPNRNQSNGNVKTEPSIEKTEEYKPPILPITNSPSGNGISGNGISGNGISPKTKVLFRSSTSSFGFIKGTTVRNWFTSK